MPEPTIYLQRQEDQRLREAARNAARRLYPGAHVSPSAHVQIVDGGAFVELAVWIPLDALGKEAVLKMGGPSIKTPRMTDANYQGKCDVLSAGPGRVCCGMPAVLRYPAMGGGYMRLCAEHGEPHRPHCGEWLGLEWSCSTWETR